MLHYEHRSKPLAPRRIFLRRLARNVLVALAVISVSLAIGMIGYRWFEGLSWLDAFLNASMLLGGMGPIDAPKTLAGKLFAGCYALYCGLIVLIAAGIILAPIAHRLMHRLHIES